MAKFKNDTKDTYDKDGKTLLTQKHTVKFTVQKKVYEVKPGETVDIPREHESFVRSRGIALTLADGESYAEDGPALNHSGPRTVGSQPGFAGDVDAAAADANAKASDVKATEPEQGARRQGR